MAHKIPEELDKLAIIDPELDAILKSGKIQSPDINYDDDRQAVDQIRAITEAWARVVERDGIKNQRHSYIARDGTEHRLLSFRPNLASDEVRLPLVVHIHGGGGCSGSPESTASFCQNLALQHVCVVVTISYRLAPEFKFPTGRNDCADAVKYIAVHAAEYGADPAQGFIIGGHSYGAAAASVISLFAVDMDLRYPITGLYLGAGSYIGDDVPSGYEDVYRSRRDERCIEAPVLNRQTKALFDKSYAADTTSTWSRACNSTSTEAIRAQPRTYFQVCGMDILRDDSFIYRDILEKHGVKTKTDIYPGMPHIFWSIFQPGIITQRDEWAVDTKEGFEWLLRRQ